MNSSGTMKKIHSQFIITRVVIKSIVAVTSSDCITVDRVLCFFASTSSQFKLIGLHLYKHAAVVPQAIWIYYCIHKIMLAVSCGCIC